MAKKRGIAGKRQAKSKKKTATNRIILIAGIIVLIVLVAFSLTQNKNNPPGEAQNKTSWEKTSGYTIYDCYEVCSKAYDLDMQIINCRKKCDFYGKPGNPLDGYVNSLKKMTERG